jgi:hypothetical protein
VQPALLSQAKLIDHVAQRWGSSLKLYRPSAVLVAILALPR